MSTTAYLFDLDGTLIDSEALWPQCIFMALKAAGANCTLQEVRNLEFGKSWEDIFRDIQTKWPGCYENRHQIERKMAPLFYEMMTTTDIVIPGSKALLVRLLQMGNPVAIVSGSTRKQIERAIGWLGVSDSLRNYVGCEDVQNGKPAPEGFLKGAKLLGIAPENCIVFEDKHLGVMAAKAAGMRCCLLQRPCATWQDPTGADWVLDDLTQFSPV